MPRAIGRAPALLSPRGGVIARPKVQSRTLIGRAAIGRSRKPKPFCYLLSQLRHHGTLATPMNCRFFRRSNFLTIRGQSKERTCDLRLELFRWGGVETW